MNPSSSKAEPNPGAILRRLRLLLAGHTGFTRFIVLSRSRTGSNMLLSFLNSHPSIHMESEIFQRLNGRTNQEVLQGIFCRRPRGVKAVGFKIFYYHPLDDEHKGIWNILLDMKGLRVIHLKRRNILRTLVSRKIAGERNVWSSLEEKAPGSEREKQIEFTADELREGFVETRTWEREYDEKFSSHPLVQLGYEDLVQAPDDEFRRITDFLGLTFHSPRSEFRKQNPEPLSRLIRNYAELRREFQESEWAAYFD